MLFLNQELEFPPLQASPKLPTFRAASQNTGPYPATAQIWTHTQLDLWKRHCLLV